MERIKSFLHMRKANNLFRTLNPYSKSENAYIIINGKEYIDFSSNDYLGLSSHPKIQKASQQAISNIGLGARASRLLSGSLELHRVEAIEVQVDTFSTDEPVLTAEDCLFNELSVGSGIVRLDGCTVLGTAYLKNVNVTNSILMNVSDPKVSGTIQYSRIPAGIKNNTDNRTVEDCTSDKPVFFSDQTTLTTRAVLAPNTPQSIYGGAGDGGEMGYFHNGRKAKPVCIEGDQSLAISEKGGYPLEDIIFRGKIEVSGGKFVLIRSAAELLTVNTKLSFDANHKVIPAEVRVAQPGF